MEIRKVQIEKYWPLIVKNIEEFGQIAVAENEEFNRITKCIYDALSDCFILEATEYGVSRWEKMLGIVPAKDYTLDDRKATILSYLSVKIPYTIPVLRQMLTAVLGDGNFEMSLDNDTQTLTIGFGLSTIHSKIDAVKSLIERVLPQNLAVELEWVDGLPMSYTRLEYLECSGTQYINTGVKATGSLKIELDVMATAWDGFVNYIFGSENKFGNIYFSMNYNNGNSTAGIYLYGTQWKYFRYAAHKLNQRYKYVFDENVVYRDGKLFPFMNDSLMTKDEFTSKRNIYLFASYHTNGNFTRTRYKKIYSFGIYDNASGRQLLNYVPSIDPVTGQAGMYDTVNKVFKTNSGSGDFIYPDKETESTTYSLRNRMYGKITEHGIRRLYRIPEGYNSKEEYAREHGFKIIVETPMPEEGYWNSVWHDREDCIELEWVEVEPPVEEEVIENE